MYNLFKHLKMSKNSIKSSLFRFVTLRSPELIENKEIGFVQIPEYFKSDIPYFNAVKKAVDEEAKNLALKNSYTKGSSFSPLGTRLSVKNIHPQLFEFSSWLIRNKTNLSYKSIKSNLPDFFSVVEDGKYTIALSDHTSKMVWENLFYQTVQKKSIHVREALIQVLVANDFVKAFAEFINSLTKKNKDNYIFTKEQKTAFTRRANASVVIPKEVLFLSKTKKTSTESYIPTSTVKSLEDNLKVVLTQERLAKYKNALAEVRLEKAKYEKENQKLYKEALATHNATIEQLINEATPVIEEEIDPLTGKISQVKTYPDLELPKFDYQAPEQLKKITDLARGAENVTALSSKTLALLEEPNFNFLTDFNEVENILVNTIKDDELAVIDLNTLNEENTVNIGGVSVTIDPVADATQTPYTYFAVARRIPFSVSNLADISMNLVIPKKGISITSANYSLKNIATNTEVNGADIEQVSNNNKMLVLNFFKGGTPMLNGSSYLFSGTITLDNGDTLSFKNTFTVIDKNVFLTKLYIISKFSGYCNLVIDDSGDDNDVSVTNTSTKFGITQLGIADFRRVEQEVCCYVPGEVSHIENVMAREYKEKQTRLLNAYEQTTEQATEQEAENLTDTSSTERNEMQSEVSSVLNEDSSQSFGANAGVSGGFGGFNFSAGTSFNSSSANSSSISNSQAQTYAQEITERALERVVKKVSSKRTSRILREFEENNSHGFDNRKGSTHVTGVYRWVDKIYKNKLINYGKRLMYEFAIPEPAKYLKKTLIANSNSTNKTDLGLITPKAPGEFTLKMSDLNASTYQSKASKYGADVKPYPETILRVTEALHSNYHTGGKEAGYFTSGKGSIKIPEGYKVNEAYASVNFNYHIYREEIPSYSIQIAGKSHDMRYAGTQKNEENIKFSNLGGVQKELAIAYESYDTGTLAISVSAVCTLTNQAIKQWQNETFKAIKEAYDTQVRRYNEFLLTQQAPAKRITSAPSYNRVMEKRELKRIAIELMTQNTNLTIAKGNSYAPSTNNTYTINVGEDLNQHASVVKFFEQAFDWEIMAYTFYPYFYAGKEDWKSMIQDREDADPIFQAFLQSGMARTVVPVRPGFEDAVNWYMATGELWNGQGLVTDIDDDLYVSVAEEMQTIEGEVEGTWETRVPTSLTVIQAGSVVLNEGGLPCNDDCENQGLFEATTATLSGTLPDGVGYDTVGANNTVA